MDWTKNREARDAAAAWAIPHLRGVPREDRISTLGRLLQRERMAGVSAEDLDRWCHAYQQPDIASGLVTKDTEAHQAALDRQAVTGEASMDEEEEPVSANQYRAEGFRVAVEGLGLGNLPNARWWYPPRKGGRQPRRRKWISKDVALRTVEGAGTATLESGEVVSWVTSCTMGERDGVTAWALPEVGPGRMWFDAPRGVLIYEIRQVERLDPRAVIGARAIAMAATYAPAVVEHRPQAQVAREHGIPSKQLLHHHQRQVRTRLEGLRPAEQPVGQCRILR